MWKRVAVAATVGVTLGALIALGVLLDLKASDWAAWVQAIGSIGAIIGAFFLATLQVSSARTQAIEVEHRRLIRRHNAISAIGAFAEKTVRRVCAAAQLFCDAQGEFVWRSDLDFLQLARDELETLRSTDLESFHLVRGIRRLAVSVDVCIRMDEALVDGLADSSDYGFWSTEAANAAANAAGALQDIEQAITEFREDPEIALPPFSLKCSWHDFSSHQDGNAQRARGGAALGVAVVAGGGNLRAADPRIERVIGPFDLAVRAHTAGSD